MGNTDKSIKELLMQYSTKEEVVSAFKNGELNVDVYHKLLKNFNSK